MDKLFIVSSDVFEHYAYRKENFEHYASTPVTKSEMTKYALLDYLDLPSDILTIARIYVGDRLRRNPLILVEDCRLPKLTWKHWKDL